jgi:hypothetical protein
LEKELIKIKKQRKYKVCPPCKSVLGGIYQESGAVHVFSTIKESVAGGGGRLPKANIASPFRRKG